MPRARNEEMQQKSHLLNTLKFISENSDFASLPSDQFKFVSRAFSKLKGALGDDWAVDIQPLEIPILNRELELHHPSLLIGGIIQGRREKISWASLQICITFTSDRDNLPSSYTEVSPEQCLNAPSCCLNQCRNQKRIVRCFHFDFQPEETDKPDSHFQYGGKIPQNDQYMGCHYCLEPFLENPRFHYPPMDLVLLFDLFIREFQTPLAKWTQEPYWKGLVFKSQHLYWEKYWEKLVGFISQSQTAGRQTLHEWIYSEGK
ncbi:MAG TPA: hypothetical protein VMW67_07490 [Desulfobacteria bacterium]|nr:hypothetical protein [Desulfobacteria bacterium]